MSDENFTLCPLCGSRRTILAERIKIDDLIRMGSKMVDWDLSSEFRDVKEEIGFYNCQDCDLQFFHPAVTGSERYYAELQKFDWYYRKDKEEYDFAHQFIRPTDCVLEVGCGNGAFARQISAKHYVGLEFSGEAVSAATAAGVVAIKESIQTHAALNQGRYDFVCAFQVLEHVAEPRAFVESCLACTKPGGLVLYSVPSADSFLAIGRNFVTNLPPHHVTRWTDQCLKNVERLFSAELVALQHEKMAPRHKKMYASLVILDSLEAALGTQRRVVNRTLRHRMLAKFSNIAASIVEKGLDNPWVVPHGPSVTAVYKKI